MRIAFFSAFYHPYRGGYAEHARHISRGLAERGFTVTVIACDTHGAPSEEERDGVRVLRMPCWNPEWLNRSFPIPRPGGVLRALRRIKGERIDAVMTATRFYPITFLGFAIGIRRRIPVVHIEHGSRHPANRNVFVRYAGLLVDHTFGYAVCRFSRTAVGVSSAAAVFARHLGARNPAVIYNPVSMEFWHPNPAARAADGMFRILFVGRLVHAKGAQDLISALAFLRSTIPPAEFAKVRLTFVGDGPYRGALENNAKQYALGGQAVFMGEQDSAAIRQELWRTSVFVNPSHSEGMPTCVLEAAACGIPVIATDVGGTGEIIPAGHGTLVPPGSAEALAGALARVFNNPSAYDEYARAARSRCERLFSLPRIVTEYESVFRAITANA